MPYVIIDYQGKDKILIIIGMLEHSSLGRKNETPMEGIKE